MHAPEGSAPFAPDPGIPVRIWPFALGNRFTGARRLLSPVLLYFKLAGLVRVSRSIGRAIDAEGCSAALVHPSMILYAPPVLPAMRTPAVFYSHEHPRHLYEPGITKTPSPLTELTVLPLRLVERRMDRRDLASASIHACNSDYVAGWIERIYGRRPVVVRPGIDSSVFTPGHPGRIEGYALSVGALTSLKGHDMAIRALALVSPSLRPRLVIQADRGHGAVAKRLEVLAAALGVSIEFRHSSSLESIVETYRQASLVICAQQAEPYGLVPLEAMACGKPVIAVNEGGFPENVEDGITGLLVRRDPPGMAAAVARVLSDRLLAESLGSRGREFVSGERTITAHTEAIAGLIEKAASL